MLQTGSNPARTPNAQVNPKPALGWDVLVTPGIPIVTPDRPPGVRETYFQAMASTLVVGTRDAVLVDAFMTVKQSNALADWIASNGKNLTTIYTWSWRPLVWSWHSSRAIPKRPGGSNIQHS